METWKDINGYEGRYQISDIGSVKSLLGKSGSGKKLKFNVIKGYNFVTLHHPFLKRKNVSVHRLVAKAFIPNPDGFPHINHLDGNRRNNAISNLEWVTQLQNVQHAIKTGLKSYAEGWYGHSCKLTKEDVSRIKKLSATTDLKVKELARVYEVSPTTIYNIIEGRRWKYVK